MISKMVFATDVSSHFKNLDVLREVSKSPVLEPKDSMVLLW